MRIHQQVDAPWKPDFDVRVFVNDLRRKKMTIPDEFICLEHWSMGMAALLVSGIAIYKAGTNEPYTRQLPRVADHYVALLEEACERWRIVYFRYVYQQWQATHGNEHNVPPQRYLDWIRDNPVPSFDNQGRPIDAEIDSPAPVHIVGQRVSLEGTKEPLIDIESTYAKVNKKHRPIYAVLKAISMSNSLDAVSVFNKLKTLAKGPDADAYDLLGVTADREGVRYRTDQRKEKILTLKVMRDRLRRLKENKILEIDSNRDR